jgi:peptidoglycan LD-endopeptidase CwlK
MDAISEARLAGVMPQLAALVRQLYERLAVENITIRVTQAVRTWADQDKLYAQGRTLPGKIVTNAKGGESWHNYGCAVDMAPMDDGIPDWNLSHPAWARIVAVGQSLGMVDGISWKDEPHFELTGKYPLKPPQEIVDFYIKEGLPAVWSAVNST